MALARPRKNTILVDIFFFAWYNCNLLLKPLKKTKNAYCKPYFKYISLQTWCSWKTLFHLYCMYLMLFYRPPHVSSNYHKRTVYVVSWGPQCIKTGMYTSILVWYSNTHLNRILYKPNFELKFQCWNYLLI